MNYYTADLHFGHINVIKHDDRPFKTIDEMEEVLINNWNSRVRDNDDVYIVGDFTFRNAKSVSYYCNRLHGRKHLILGNHDRLKDEDRECFVEICDLKYINDHGRKICLCHYPIAEWNGYFRGDYLIYGHIHNNKNAAFDTMSKYERALNAGCMINNYMPVTFEELVENNKIFRGNIETIDIPRR